ncbi:putative glutamate decarboxylase, Glutamine synthetase [Lupinus albus]|uniref:Putative glutamate decarboxylase, Glutamine synthetase n=1 Tax=Lupinus albus TaxID=3870 RepID=A0A6A4PDI7_LUPAL|nr:putative glutamate decarboxylase, Glutamine synthetase [Lupinus albus]
MQKMKKIITTDKKKYGLRVMVMKVDGVDHPSLHPLVVNRLYNVVCWVEPGEELFCTTLKQSLIFIQWMDEAIIPLENPNDHGFLYVEVIRYMSEVDPGTSHGRVVVGRAKIPIPREPGHQKKGVFDLVRTCEGELKLEGCIMISMTLETMIIM